MPDSADTYLHMVIVTLPTIYGWCYYPWITYYSHPQVGTDGRFGTKWLAITFVTSASDSDVLLQVSKADIFSFFNLCGMIIKAQPNWYFACLLFEAARKVRVRHKVRE